MICTLKQPLLAVQAYIIQNILKQYVCKYLALGGEPEIEAAKLVVFKFVFIFKHDLTLFRCFFLQYPDVSVLKLNISKCR